MKIRSIAFGMLRAPLHAPFKTALRTVHQVEDVVLIVASDDGRLGYGSAPATPAITGETHETIIETVRREIGPRLLGASVERLNKLTHAVQASTTGNTSAKAAVEIALYDLHGQLRDAPIYQLLGGGKTRLMTDMTISVNDIAVMVEDASRALEQGFEALKIKVGDDPAQDVERIKAIYALAQGRARIRLDANQGWTPEQAVRAIRSLEADGVRLEWVEQPVGANDLDGMRQVKANVKTPVMADESAFGPREALNIINSGAADVINIKLMKTGGISNAIKVADISHLCGARCLIGCMLESSIGVAAAAHVAAAKSTEITMIDLDAPVLCAEDPVRSGVSFDRAEISISDAPGLGITEIGNLEMLDVRVV